MPIWDKLRSELDRAGKAAQHAIDEGKLRLEVMRVRQVADRAAQALGYAVYKADKGIQPLDEGVRTRLMLAVDERLAEVARLEDQLKAARGQ
jgi:hypothetical protein